MFQVLFTTIMINNVSKFVRTASMEGNQIINVLNATVAAVCVQVLEILHVQPVKLIVSRLTRTRITWFIARLNALMYVQMVNTLMLLFSNVFYVTLIATLV